MESSLPHGTGERGTAFHIGNPRSSDHRGFGEQFQNGLPSLLPNERLYEGTRIEIELQRRSSVTYSDSGGPGVREGTCRGGMNFFPDQLIRPSAIKFAM